MSAKVGIVILAAGKGTRLKISTPKPLVPLFGKKLIDFVIGPVQRFLKSSQLVGNISVVIGHEGQQVKDYLSQQFGNQFVFCEQKQMLGTADALRAYFADNKLAKTYEYTLVLCADTPLLDEGTFQRLFNELTQKGLDGVVASFDALDPYGYGRIVREDKAGMRIVEEKDANESERMITEVNSGLYALKTDYILKHLYLIEDKNQSKEFYLTDLFTPDRLVRPVKFEDGSLFKGVNTLAQLAECEKVLREKCNQRLMDKGVYLVDPQSCTVQSEAIASGCTIYPHVWIDAKTEIGEGSIVEPHCVIKDSKLGANCLLKAGSYLEGANIGQNVHLGPYANLRPGSRIDDDCRVGNFVEIKNSHFKKGAKASHLSYIGDAEIGERVNLGCGFITCNYDGANKHRTVIGDGTFVGSDSQMVAPVSIGKNCYIASGSTINKDLKDGDFAIARNRQETRPGLAKRFLKTK